MSMMNAISGLLASSNCIDVISNNIANASTTGFKSSTLSFCDIVSQSLIERNSMGSGAEVSGLVQNFNNGTLINTGRELDIGINQDGFFRVLDSRGRVHYTRNGQFSIDKQKNIVNMQGLYVTGQNNDFVNNSVNHQNHLEPINLKKRFVLLAQPTQTIRFSPILNTNANPNAGDNDIYIPYNTSLTIYDQDTNPQKIDIRFDKENQDKNIWKVYVKSRNMNDNLKNKKINSVFTIEFDDAGQLISSPTFIIPKTQKNSLYQPITLNLTGIISKKDSKETFDLAFQDGYPEGTLKSFDILPTGEIIGTYSNQQMHEMGQIMLAKFINPTKLKAEGSNLWSSTVESGQEHLGTAGSIGFGTLVSKNLETSNVDLNKELLNMIVAQRNYQSNAQVLKAEDKILSTLVNLR
ncbi:flagellar hook protein FlgE [Buchnera aphidicola]|uniref:flagellar hook protein FlgE n=1 Tax=Buchnera aphidicola TaxID=9 RepID=UPI003BEF1609